MMKSITLSRAGVSESGAMVMSTWFEASTGTFVSWLTGTTSSLTPSRLAYSLARIQAGPENLSPLPLVFSGSQGNSPIAPTRSVPRCLIAFTRGEFSGGGPAGAPLAAGAVGAAAGAVVGAAAAGAVVGAAAGALVGAAAGALGAQALSTSASTMARTKQRCSILSLRTDLLLVCPI